jgi:hypothetical protein
MDGMKDEDVEGELEKYFLAKQVSMPQVRHTFSVVV